MKLISCFLILSLIVSCSSTEDVPFVVEGNVRNSGDKTIYLEENKPGRERPVILDSAQLDKNGHFKLNARSKDESLFSLRIGQGMFPFAIIVNDSKKISINADLARGDNTYSVQGSKASQEILDFDQRLSRQGRAMYMLTMTMDSVGQNAPSDSIGQRTLDSTRNALYSQYQTVATQLKDYTKNLINNSNSPTLIIYAFDLLQRMFSQFQMKAFNPTETVAIVNSVSSRFPENAAVKEWKKKTGTSKAPDFALPDTSGRTVSLSSFKGKYILIDFWASWCGPCRQENPNVVSAYNQFKNKNFTILGVSLDQNRDAWLKAIRDDGLYWNQVSDLKFWNSEAASLYNVSGIPYNFLVDPDGNIIAENIRGPELISTLSSILK
jgi:peroxiredoxin